MQCPCLQAKVPSMLRYLDGCKHFEPRGRWVKTPVVHQLAAITVNCLDLHISMDIYQPYMSDEANIFEELNLKRSLKAFVK